jgi:hypothetical protein
MTTYLLCWVFLSHFFVLEVNDFKVEKEGIFYDTASGQVLKLLQLLSIKGHAFVITRCAVPGGIHQFYLALIAQPLNERYPAPISKCAAYAQGSRI